MESHQWWLQGPFLTWQKYLETGGGDEYPAISKHLECLELVPSPSNHSYDLYWGGVCVCVTFYRVWPPCSLLLITMHYWAKRCLVEDSSLKDDRTYSTSQEPAWKTAEEERVCGEGILHWRVRKQCHLGYEKEGECIKPGQNTTLSLVGLEGQSCAPAEHRRGDKSRAAGWKPGLSGSGLFP